MILRFCSQPFKIEDLHESIHLCNNAIQVPVKTSSSCSIDETMSFLRFDGSKKRLISWYDPNYLSSNFVDQIQERRALLLPSGRQHVGQRHIHHVRPPLFPLQPYSYKQACLTIVDRALLCSCNVFFQVSPRHWTSPSLVSNHLSGWW